MKNSPIYKKSFSRDFTLVSLEIWWRGEALNDKIWTAERQPFSPYIVFERTGETVDSFYDPRGIFWVKNLLLEKIRKDDKFLGLLEKNLLKGFSETRTFFDKKNGLNRTDFCRFLSGYEKRYVWLEAAWWLWDMTEKELNGMVLPDSFLKLRVETQDYIPKSEQFIRHSLSKIYPKLSDLTEVLRISEIQENKIPDMEELIKRKGGYYFTDNKFFTGISREDIEKKYSIKLETVDIENVKELRGQSAYKGEVSGKVKIILGGKSLSKIERGDILVSTMTLPDFLPAIKKAAAVITDEGGLLSHAAIIARELKKPCIIGTRVATKVLKDGDVVEVNANKGIVKIITA